MEPGERLVGLRHDQANMSDRAYVNNSMPLPPYPAQCPLFTPVAWSGQSFREADLPMSRENWTVGGALARGRGVPSLGEGDDQGRAPQNTNITRHWSERWDARHHAAALPKLDQPAGDGAGSTFRNHLSALPLATARSHLAGSLDASGVFPAHCLRRFSALLRRRLTFFSRRRC